MPTTFRNVTAMARKKERGSWKREREEREETRRGVAAGLNSFAPSFFFLSFFLCVPVWRDRKMPFHLVNTTTSQCERGVFTLPICISQRGGREEEVIVWCTTCFLTFSFSPITWRRRRRWPSTDSHCLLVRGQNEFVPCVRACVFSFSFFFLPSSFLAC